MEISLAELADMIEGKLVGDSKKIIHKAVPFEDAKEDDITFAGASRFLNIIKESNAGAVIVPRGYNEPSKNLIQVDQPHIAFIKILNVFYPTSVPKQGVSPSAHVGEGFKCGNNVSIAPNVVIGDNVVLGDRVSIYPCTYIGDGVAIGDDAKIYSNVSVLERCKIGNRVIIHAGSVIGSDGFGYSSDGKIHYKIPHTGIVQIDDDVEIGAGNTIDRATFGKTWICRGVKTDNLVHIAHNVTVGEDTLLIAQAVIGGSTSIGKHSIIAGQAVISDHIVIGDNVTVAPKSGVIKSVKNGEIVTGAPAMPHKLWRKVQTVIPRLPELRNKLIDIEKRLNNIEKKGDE